MTIIIRRQRTQQPQYPVELSSEFGLGPKSSVIVGPAWNGNNAWTQVNVADCSTGFGVRGGYARTSPAVASRTSWRSRDDILITGAAPRTLFTRIYFSTAYSDARGLFAYGSETIGTLFELSVYYSNALIGHFYGGGYDTISGATTLTPGNFYDLALVYDGNTNVKIYVNGVLAQSATLGGVLATTASKLSVGGVSTYVGKTPADFDCYIVGLLDVALTAKQVVNLKYNPWQIFRPRQVTIPVVASGASAPTLVSASAINIAATAARARVTFTR